MIGGFSRYNYGLIFDDLREIQRQYGYLPADQLEALSRRSQIPLPHIHGVADFFPHFHLSPPPRVTVQVCADMSCHLRGADELRGELSRRFGSMSDRDIAITDVSCLGQCDGAPAVRINDHSFRNVTAPQAEAIAISALGGSPPKFGRWTPSQRTGLKADPYQNSEPYGALRKLAQTRDFDGVIAQLKASGLGGLGGAGFPTGVKWEAVRKTPATEKYVICNADESEPGTIKDRFILGHLTHLVIEGMIVAGLVTGARKGILYIRHEYEPQEHLIAEEIRRCYESGLLGPRVCGSDLPFDLELFVSPGGYICGEETALMEAIEGKRAEPRNKPPVPGLRRLVGQADRAQQRGNFRQRAADPGERSRLVQVAGRERVRRAEIRRRERRRPEAGRLSDPDGNADGRGDLSARRRHREAASG